MAHRPAPLVVTLVLIGCAGPAAPPSGVLSPTAQLPSAAPTASSRPSTPRPSAIAQPATPAPASALPALDAALTAAIAVAEGPIELAATDDTVWVEAHRANYLTRIDPVQNVETDRLTGVAVHCEVTVGGGFVWTSQASSGTITKVDPATGEAEGTARLLTACGIAADDGALWATSPDAGRAIRYDPGTLEVEEQVALGNTPLAIALAPDAAWVVGEADGGTVWRIDRETDEVAATISVPLRFATGLEVGLGSVWVPAREEHRLYRLDPSTNSIAATISLPFAVGGVGASSDALWVSGFGNGSLCRVDPATDTISGCFQTEFANLGPPLVAFGSVWVGALDESLVLRLDVGSVAGP